MAAYVLTVVGLLLMVTCCHHGVTSTRKFVKNKLSTTKYHQHGDLMIGAIVSAEERRSGDLFVIPNEFSFHLVESVAYAIDLVNRNQTLLPDIKLGFIMLDDHFSIDAAVLRAIAFMKQRRSRQNNQCVMNTNNRYSITSYDVVGVIGCFLSMTTEAAGLLLGGAQVPLISYSATSPILSDKQKYPYFLRVIPEFTMNVEAVFEFCLLHNWTYISVFYTDGTYGEGMYDKLREKIGKDVRICLAIEVKFHRYNTPDVYFKAVQDVKNLGSSRVVLTFLDDYAVHAIVSTIISLREAGWIIWVMNEPFVSRILDLYNYNDLKHVSLFSGSIYLGFKTYVTEGYNKHVSKLRPDTHTNPWFKKYWMDKYSCQQLDENCLQNDVNDLHGVFLFRLASVAQRAVYSVAFGIDRVIKNFCSRANKSELPECVTGPRLLQEMKDALIYTDVGRIAFDENGNGINNVLISQIDLEDNGKMTMRDLAEFDPQDLKYTILQPFSFNHLNLSKNGRIRSHCSEPCPNGQYKSMSVKGCCWNCSPCNREEIVHPSHDKCVVCPQFYHPAQNQTVCESIPIDDYHEMFIYFVIYNILALAAILALLMIAVTLFRHKNHDIVRDTGIVFCYMLIASAMSGFLTVPMFNNLQPTEFSCNATFFIFCVSLVLVNGSLLVKVVSCHLLNYNKISLTTRRLVYEVGFSLLIALLQVYVCVEITLVYQIKPKLHQSFKEVQRVEFSCNWSNFGFYFFFSYNGAMLVSAFILALINRKFQFNNREVRYIGIVVYANIITWISFTISFFSSTNQMVQKRMSIMSAVLANNILVMVFYLAPKLVHIYKTPMETEPSPVVVPDVGATLTSQSDVYRSNLQPDAPFSDLKAELTEKDVRRPTLDKGVLETPEDALNAITVETGPPVDEPPSTLFKVSTTEV